MRIVIECPSGNEFDLGDCSSKVEAYIAVNALVATVLGASDEEDGVTFDEVTELIEEIGVFTEVELPFTTIAVQVDEATDPREVVFRNLPDGLFDPFEQALTEAPGGLISNVLVVRWWSDKTAAMLGDLHQHFGSYYGVEEDLDQDSEAPMFWFGFMDELASIIDAQIKGLNLPD